MTQGRSLALIIALFIALSAANYLVFHNNTSAINAETKRQLSKGEFAKEYRKFIAEVERASKTSGQPVHVKFEEEPTLRLNHEYRWFIGREIVLTVVAIGGVWALYFYGGKKRRTASP